MNKQAKIFLVIAIALGLALGLVLWRFTVDDSYISYRYSKNLSDGAGIVWNKGEKPVEGYTNFLWVVILAAFIKAGLDPVVVSKLLGLLLLAGTGVLAYSAGVKLLEKRTPVLAVIPVLIFSINASFVIHAVSGLETMLFSFVLMAIAYLALEAVENNSSRTRIMLYSCFLISGLVRPEGVLFSFITFIVLLFMDRQTRSLKSLKWFLVCFILPGAAYMAWRLAYFGYLLPNTFYIKGTPGKPLVGLEYVGSFVLGYYGVYIILLLLCAILVREKKKYIFIIPALTVIAYYCTVLSLMGYCFRYLMPFYPLLLVPLVLLPDKLLSKKDRRFKFRLAGVAVVCLGLLFLSYLEFSGIMGYARDYSEGLKKVHVKFGKALKSAVGENPEKYTLAVGDAGAMPFYSEFRAIDTIGLNDVNLARKGFDSEYVFINNPDVLVLYSEDGKTASFTMGSGHDYIISLHPAMANYDLRGVLQFGQGYFMLCYFRRAMPNYQNILMKIAAGYQ